MTNTLTPSSGDNDTPTHHPRWRARLVVIATALLVTLLVADAWMVVKGDRYRAEIQRLRASMTELERRRADEIIAREQNKLRLALQLLRRQAQLERTLHLSIALDSATMELERDGVSLRRMYVQIGPERRIGSPPDTVHLAAPRGVRTVTRVVLGDDSWEVPSWVYLDRGLAVAANRIARGALGPFAVLLDGGTVIYSLPSDGPLSDSAYVLPGAIRARAEDLHAIVPNLRPGVRVYFY